MDARNKTVRRRALTSVVSEGSVLVPASYVDRSLLIIVILISDSLRAPFK